MQVMRNALWFHRRKVLTGLSVVAITVLARLVAQEPAPPANEDSENRIFIGQPDGSGMKPLVSMTDYRVQGSPTWSQDGKLIAFDAWRPALVEKNTDSKVIVVNADGSDPKILGDGAMPSFSPRHNRIAFSRYEPNYGVWVMSSEGPESELVLLDDQGWSAKWSPDGRQIAYTVPGENAANLVVFDLVEGVRIALFEEGKSPYSSFFWNFSWSPDGRRIAFKGQRIGSEMLEVGIIDARGATHGLVTRHESKNISNVSWSHDSRRILFAEQTPQRNNRVQIFSMDANTNDPPEPLAGQDATRGNNAAAPSPDGKQLLIVSRKPPPAKNNPVKGKAKKAN
jgi:TolB protein